MTKSYNSVKLQTMTKSCNNSVKFQHTTYGKILIRTIHAVHESITSEGVLYTLHTILALEHVRLSAAPMAIKLMTNKKIHCIDITRTIHFDYGRVQTPQCMVEFLTK